MSFECDSPGVNQYFFSARGVTDFTAVAMEAPPLEFVTKNTHNGRSQEDSL